MNLYTDFNPKVCVWEKEIIKAGLVPPGEVWERDISDIKAEEIKKFTQCHFFAGILGWPYALRLAGWPDNRPIWTASLPCQSFSCAGKGGGFNDERGQLWFPFFSLVKECRPSIIVGEQVPSAINKGWLDRIFGDLEAEGYACGAAVLPACSVGSPHLRQRIFWVAHRRLAEDAESERRGGGSNHDTIAGRCKAEASGLRPDGGRAGRRRASGTGRM